MCVCIYLLNDRAFFWFWYHGGNLSHSQDLRNLRFFAGGAGIKMQEPMREQVGVGIASQSEIKKIFPRGGLKLNTVSS